MRRLILLLLLPLAACATPRQQCETAATRDLQVVSALIVETQQNIARGYAIEREVVERPRLTFCYGRNIDDDGFGYTFCNRTEVDVRERAVAIDLKAERSKLAELKLKQAELRRQAARALAACAARYPQT